MTQLVSPRGYETDVMPPADGSGDYATRWTAAVPVSDSGPQPEGAVPHPEVNEMKRENEVFRVVRDPETYEVHVDSDVTLEDYKSISDPEVWALLEQQVARLQGKRVVFINPTMAGGGVAMLRPTMVHMLRQFGVDAHWYVMADIKGETDPSEPYGGDPFGFTKTMHNISQRQAGDERITDAGKQLHERWAAENWEVLQDQEPILTADFLVIDDPQPAPLYRNLREVNPDAKIGWRNHIDTDRVLMADPETPQGEVSWYIMHELGIGGVDFAFHHPNNRFVHNELDHVSYPAPATIDPFDNLNRHLDDGEVIAGMEFLNSELAAQNARFAGSHPEYVQPMLDMAVDKKRITLIARFDESKGMDKAMELGCRVREQLRAYYEAHDVPAAMIDKHLPEVVIIGNGSKDDPSGPKVLEQMLRLRADERFAAERHGIIVGRMGHNYDAMNALMRRSSVLMQTSDAEGLETRITDGIQHGLPVVISNRGGMFTQIPESERSGSAYARILDYDAPDHDLDSGVRFMYELFTDPERYSLARQEALRNAQEYNRVEFTTAANVLRFARAFNNAADGVPADKEWLVAPMANRASRTRAAAGALATGV